MHIFARALALIFVVGGLGVIYAPKALAADEPHYCRRATLPRGGTRGRSAGAAC